VLAHVNLLGIYVELFRRNRALARLLAGEFISGIGDWLYLVAILVVVYAESRSPVLLGIVGAARILPYVILSIPAGIVADRFDRRMVLLVTDVARGILMLLLVVAVGAGLAVASGTLEVEASALSTIGVVLLWFPLGYALYASMYAAAGALVSRQEDLQSSSGPLNLIVVAAYVVSFQAIDDPAGGLARIAGLVPFTAPLIQPVRLVTGEGSLAGALAAVAIIVITTLVIIRVAATIYERAILRTGKPVRLREALRPPGGA